MMRTGSFGLIRASGGINDKSEVIGDADRR